MNRETMRAAAFGLELWDIVVIGGGATGVGIAVDAAARGYRTLLLEQHDFGKGTSSRSTKLLHGGVRYLRQGNISLVREALRERGLLKKNAPHLANELSFIVPSYSLWTKPYYGIGLKLYDWLAGKLGFTPTRFFSKADVIREIPTIQQQGLRGGVVYSDGQFDDTELLINLAATAADHGATLLNYARVTAIKKDESGMARGVELEDAETGDRATVNAKVVINASGPFCDGVRKLADPAATNLVSPSQGVHLVFARHYLPGDYALMVPDTPDGRVLFAIPWHGHTLVGTTDVSISETPLEPLPTEKEIDFILETAGRYLRPAPTRLSILSMWAGIRPLVRAGKGRNTAALSRDHTIHVDASKLVTITGGKWTTYRNMAEDCVNRAAEIAGLPSRPCVTKEMHIPDRKLPNEVLQGDLSAGLPGVIREQFGNGTPLHADLNINAADVLWAVRYEMARTVEDVLARRNRALFLNARAAIEIAPRVAELLARELNRDESWQRQQVQEFTAVAGGYLPRDSH